MIPEIATIKVWGIAAMGAASPFIGTHAVSGFMLGLIVLLITKGVLEGDTGY